MSALCERSDHVPSTVRPLPDASEIAQNSDLRRRAKCLSYLSENMSLELRIIPFEPFAWVAGKKTGEREDKLAEKIRHEIQSQALTQFLENRASRLVSLRIQFFLWAGGSNVTNTRPLKDVDNLLNVIFDVLKVGPHGVGLIESDSYICDVHATKHLVAEQKDEGYKISIEEYGDEWMLRTLKDFPKEGS